MQATIRYIFAIYLLGLFSVISMFSNKNFFTVMICMLNKSCPDSLMVYTVKKKVQMITINVNFSVIIRYRTS